MKGVLSILSLLAVSVFAYFSCRSEVAPPFAVGIQGESEGVDAAESGDSSSARDLAPLPVSRGVVREAVESPEDERKTGRDCEVVEAELREALAAKRAARLEAEELRAQLEAALREVDRLRFPEDTPYGAFLASDEAKDITDPAVRQTMKAWLEVFPIILRSGEASWLAERAIANDYGKYGEHSEEAVILFLGVQRLEAELPPELLAEFRESYADDDRIRFSKIK